MVCYTSINHASLLSHVLLLPFMFLCAGQEAPGTSHLHQQRQQHQRNRRRQHHNQHQQQRWNQQ
jgi:hypothetical protein